MRSGDYYTPQASMLDASAPFELVEMTAAVRDVLAPLPSRWGDDLSHDLYGRCPEASQSLALGLRRRGLPAAILSCDQGDIQHLVAHSGPWLLDATAEQFGVEGPVVRPLRDFPSPRYALSIDHDPIEPAELELICELAPDFDRDEPNKATALLRATGLDELEAGLHQLAWDEPGNPKECFCGGAPAGWWHMDLAHAWGCEAHLAPCGLRGSGGGIR